MWKLKTQKLGLDRLAIQNFLNEFPVFDTPITRNSKQETHLGNLVKTEPEGLSISFLSSFAPYLAR
jgi:phosphorylcholine metabolism protein LicD